MFSFNKIITVGIYEMRTLLRSWFFRIFAGLSVLIIGIFNIAANIENSGAPFIYRALPASLPYVNLLILNVGQAVVAVFLASEFLKQDRKNDTIEVIYARSMTNAEYILGKAFGISLVFLFLNVLMLSIGVGFSFLGGDTKQGIIEYLYYPVLISLPTLVYILGLSFLLMILTKNQAITFIILLGYIAVSVIYLDKQYYQVFDFIAYQIPMMKSTIGGFAALNETIVHRGIYFFIGVSLIFFTITRLDRLPQSRSFGFLPVVISVLSLAMGLGLAYKYINIKTNILSDKKEMILLNNKYLDYPVVTVDTCSMDLQHNGKTIEVNSRLVITNNTNITIDTLIFSLNPGLTINNASYNNTKAAISAQMQIRKIALANPVKPGNSGVLNISYSGYINEDVCFLDQNLEEFRDNFSFEIFRLKKRYAYLNPDFVLLTRDALWYPVSGVGYSSESPAKYSPDFTVFDLNVNTRNDLTAISQGQSTMTDDGDFQFRNNTPLPQISLLIGDYKSRTIKVDSVIYSIYTVGGNDYYSEYFQNISDSLPGIIRELKNEYEVQLDLAYPFNRFSLAEVPIQYYPGKHIWSLTSDAVQPEMIFYSEKGVLLTETDFKKRKKRTERSMKRNKEEITPAELESRIFKRFVRGNFMAGNDERFMLRNMDKNTLSVFPNYYTFTSSIESDNWPALNLSLQSYIKDRYSNPVSSYRWFFTDLSKDERINLELSNSSLAEFKKLRKTNETDREEVDIYDIILAKGDFLFSIFRARYGDEEFNALLDSLIDNNRYHKFTLNYLDEAIQSRFGSSIYDDINDWYYGLKLPGFMITDLETYKVLDGEYTKYQIKFKIANPEPTDGVVTINVDLYDPNERNNRSEGPPDFTQKIYLPANTAKEAGFVFSAEPVRMNIYTHISRNLPNNLIYDFGSFDETRKTAVLDGVRECDMFEKTVAEGEIIIDNEDSTFSFSQSNQVSYLKRLVDKNKDPGYPYTGIRWWNPPANWQQVLRSGFYGKYIRSAMYTKTGKEDRTAKWKANISDKGYYDIYFHTEKINVNRRHREQKKSDYNFKVYHQGGMDELNFPDSDIENGWNYIGTYYLSGDTAVVELTNKSVGPMIFADAIKWIKN